MTPWEMQVIATAEGDRLDDHYRMSLSVAWHGEFFARSKKLPDHSSIIARRAKEESSKPHSVDEAALKLAFERHNKRVKQENG